MGKYRLSNLFTPSISLRIVITNHNHLEPIILNQNIYTDDSMTKYSVPIGISDAARVNQKYKELINDLALFEVTNSEAQQVVARTWTKEWNSEDMIVDPKFLINNSNIMNEDVKESDLITEKEVIYWWRWSRLDTNSIAAKLNLTKHFVSRTIKNYKILVKKNVRENILKRNNKKAVISPEKLDEIRAFCRSNSNKIIRIKDIKQNIWKNSIEVKAPSDSTLATSLRMKLRMTYRLLKTRHPKTLLIENRRLYIEAALIQCFLGQDGYEIIFIDEFHIDNRK